MVDGWLGYYWALAKEFGIECLHITRSDMLATVLTIILTFLKTGNALDFGTGLLICFEVLLILGILHSLRLPWQLFERMRAQKPRLSNWWGVLGVAFFSLFISALVYAVVYVSTMQPKVVMSPVSFATKSADVMALEHCKSELAHLTSPEPNDSLRRRTLKVADEYFQFARKRFENHPPYGNVNDKEPSEEAKKVLAVYKQYDQETADQYNRLYRDRFVGILREYQHKGVPVGWLETSAQNGSLMWILPGGSWEGTPSDQLTAFRNLAYRVDARDQLIVLTY